ncbi:hypothetical protein DFJ74DRAFT_672124 [Hyaloraphidium curvatum]|nr:hypothetical protein DFJ74DRAFT_672124 [Hyaloraphidium curvatum]
MAEQADDDNFGDFGEVEPAADEFDAFEEPVHAESREVPDRPESTQKDEPGAAEHAEPKSASSSAFDDLFDFRDSFSAVPPEGAIVNASKQLEADAAPSPAVFSGEAQDAGSLLRTDSAAEGEFFGQGETEVVGSSAEAPAEDGTVSAPLEDGTLSVQRAPVADLASPSLPNSSPELGDAVAVVEGEEQLGSPRTFASTASPVIPNVEAGYSSAASAPIEATDGGDVDDDFGDFGEVDETASAGPASPITARAPPAEAPETLGAAPDAIEDRQQARTFGRVDFSSAGAMATSLSSLFEALFPVQDDTPPAAGDSEPSRPLLVERMDGNGRLYLAPNPERKDEEWYADWQRLVDAPTYDEETGLPLFQWRRSQIRKTWLKALQVPVNLDDIYAPPKSVRSKAPSEANVEQPKASSADPLAARALGMDETDLRQLSVLQLRDMVNALTKAVKEESNGYNKLLDRKQRLADESDRHNKMIATLVQIAQAQSVKGKR